MTTVIPYSLSIKDAPYEPDLILFTNPAQSIAFRSARWAWLFRHVESQIDTWGSQHLSVPGGNLSLPPGIKTYIFCQFKQ